MTAKTIVGALALAVGGIVVSAPVWRPRIHRSQTDLINALKHAGLMPDDAGRFVFSGQSPGGVALAYDPNLHDAISGWRSSVARMSACITATKSIDECVNSAPRCKSPTPWKGDPSGDDCWPESCQRQYLESRKTQTAAVSLSNLANGKCYPGIDAEMNEDSPSTKKAP
jgi:hypothetical protein